jgi:hypothetical protein
MEVEELTKFVVHESVDPQPQIKQVCDRFKWQLAFAEGLWNLIYSGQIIANFESVYELPGNQSWTTVVPGSGGHSSGWDFHKAKYPLPIKIKLAPSVVNRRSSLLFDADLYLADIDIPDMNEKIREALVQSIDCFKIELYLPALAMLGMAVEGAWIELGSALIDVNIEHPKLSFEFREKHRENLSSPYSSFLRKMESVFDVYKNQDIYKPITKKSGYGHKSLNQVMSWSNVIRDSRNELHFNTRAASSNTYDKVAALILGVNQNFRIIYSITRSAREFEETKG